MNCGAITITTGSRLHFGPLAWKPRRGRDFGGWGVMLQTPRTVVRIAQSGQFSDRPDRPLRSQPRAERILNQLVESNPLASSARLEAVVAEEPPPHCGFGSGSQLALALATGVTWLTERRRPTAVEIAPVVQRGLRSAVGIHGFDLGGLLVDAGKRPGEDLGQLAARLPFPPAWRFVLIRPPAGEGFAGDQEAAAFNNLPAFSDAISDRLSRLVLTEVLPSIQAEDFPAFASALDEYGMIVGEAFSPCQGGVVHPASTAIWSSARRLGLAGLAQTSWGPTLALVCQSQTEAETAAATLRGLAPSSAVSIALPKNDGAGMQFE